VPSVPHSVNKIFTERRTLPSAALSKVGVAECPIKSTRQSRRHSAKSRIPVVNGMALDEFKHCLACLLGRFFDRAKIWCVTP
jgi:hypothetical protein